MGKAASSRFFAETGNGYRKTFMSREHGWRSRDGLFGGAPSCRRSRRTGLRVLPHRSGGPRTSTVQHSNYLRVTAVSFGIYIVGYVIFIVGAAMGAHLLNVPPQWIGVGVVCLIGVAIVHGATATRQKDAAS